MGIKLNLWTNLFILGMSLILRWTIVMTSLTDVTVS